MASSPPLAPPRWIPFVTVILAIMGTTTIITGLMFSIGGWRSTVDGKLDELDKRVTVTEQTQRTNLPSFYALQRDVAYLAERARQQEQREQARRP